MSDDTADLNGIQARAERRAEVVASAGWIDKYTEEKLKGLSDSRDIPALLALVTRLQEQLTTAKADAWDEGFEAGERDVFNHDKTEWDDTACIPNPYCATPEDDNA